MKNIQAKVCIQTYKKETLYKIPTYTYIRYICGIPFFMRTLEARGFEIFE